MATIQFPCNKCVYCLLKKPDFVPPGYEDWEFSKEAITILGGKSLCYEHFLEEARHTNTL